MTSRSSTRPEPAGSGAASGAATIRGSRSSSSNSRAPEAVARWARPSVQPSVRTGAEQHEQVAVEGGELAEREAAVDDHPAADEQQRREAELGQEADERVVERAQPRGDHRLVEDAADALR